MYKSRLLYILSTLAIILASCSSSKPTDAATPLQSEPAELPVHAIGGNPVSYIPKALIYKTNGDYANNVSITLNPEGTVIVSYPAPTDINAASTPVDLGDGWLLDRRGGISYNTAFTKFTYTDYAAMPQAPTPAQLMSSIIPGAKVIEIIQLPITVNQAIDNPETARQYIPEK